MLWGQNPEPFGCTESDHVTLLLETLQWVRLVLGMKSKLCTGAYRHLPVLSPPTSLHPLPWLKSKLRCHLSEAFLVYPIKNNFPQCYFEMYYPVLFVFSHRTCHYVKISHLFTYLLTY